MKDRKIVIELHISKIVPVTSNDGGYCGRECLFCGASGYERDSDYGYRFGTKKGLMGNEIVHTRQCVVNQYIDRETGKLLPK